MARIPEAEIERLKTEVSLERLVEARGIALKRHGADLIGLCPFHDDRSPSLVISHKKNLWHCLGACQTGGSVIDWVMKSEGVSFRHAVEILREGLPTSPLAAAPKVVKQSTTPKLPAPITFDADDAALLRQVIDYYHATLKQSPEALAYLQKRGIGSPEAIEHFQLGYANRTLGLRLPSMNRKAGSEIRTRLIKLGLLRASGHEHFNGSLIIPVLDAHGAVTEVYGRKLLDNLRPGTAYHLYLPGPHRGVWNLEALAASKEIILCEALIDALTFWCAGYRHVTASYGVEGFTPEHLAAFKHHGTERVLIAYDRDAAGEGAAEKLDKQLMAERIACYRVQFPKGMDANEYALKVTPATKSLGVALRKAVWIGEGQAPTTLPAAEPVVITPHVAEDSFSPLAADMPIAPSERPELPASPLPPAPAPDIEAQVSDSEVVMQLWDRRYRIRGLSKNLGVDLLKVNVLVSRGEAFYVDTLDLYAAKQRQSYLTHAAIELQVKEDILKTDLGRVLLKLEALQEAALTSALQPAAPALPEMTDAERKAALSLLQSPDLIERILADFDTCGLIGEATNKIIGYLAAVSRKLDRPLGVVVQSSSAAGKSSLMDAVLAFVPEEERVKYSAMTGQSLFYMGETNLQHKALALVEEEGASRASYALKLLQSEGELTIASTGKDPQSGTLITQQYRVQGPVALLLTTTARDIDEELLNRCLVLTVDESRQQTQAIHALQRNRRTLDGLMAKREREALLQLHQNAQRLLRPLDVLNPYAHRLTFPDQTTRLRRDHEKYLTLIDTVAFLHQHQRAVKTCTRGGQAIDYIEVTLEDIALAKRLAHEVLGRSLDELPPQTRRLLTLIDGYVSTECTRQAIQRRDYRFSRRPLRKALKLGDTQLKVHLARLTELEYLIAHRSRHGGFDYELVYETTGEEDSVRLPGLIDIEALRQAYDAERSGSTELRSGGGRPSVGPRSVSGRDDETATDADGTGACSDLPLAASKTHVQRGNGKRASYPPATVTAL